MAKGTPARHAEPGAPRGRRSLGIPMVWIPALALVAVAPWLVPWQDLRGDTQAVAPPSVAQSEKSVPESAPSAQAPDDSDVDDVIATVKGAQGYDLPVSPEEAAKVNTKPGPHIELGRVQIPDVGVDAVFGEGVYEEALTKGPGHWPGTPLPGRRGNAVLSGHRNTHTQPFKELDRVEKGDRVTITVGKDDPVNFTVTETAIVPVEEYKEFVLAQPSDSSTRQVTLFACHPEGNPIYRIVIRATVSS